MKDRRLDVRDPRKERARNTLKRAVLQGRIKRPTTCPRCGGSKSTADGRAYIQAHHHDYDSPLDVEWLCAACHFAEDRTAAGEHNNRAKLTITQTEEIRTSTLPERHLAKIYGVHSSTIGRIRRGQRWNALAARDAATGEK
jgi:hypothetical protein